MSTLNTENPDYVSKMLRDMAFRCNLNQPHNDKDLEECRMVVGWLKETADILQKAKERDFDLYLEDMPEERDSNAYRITAAVHNTLMRHQKGAVDFPVDHITKIRWAERLSRTWSMDNDSVSLSREQADEIGGRFFDPVRNFFQKTLEAVEDEAEPPSDYEG